MRVLVTGGTGVLGKAVVQELIRRDHGVTVLSRRDAPPDLPDGVTVAHGDLGTGAGLQAAVDDCATIVHCATDMRRHRQVDVEGTRMLVEAAERAGGGSSRPHLVYISIVGCDRIPLGYYNSKALAELAIAQSKVPWTVLRATQFHDLLLALGDYLSKSPVVPLPRGVQDQPVSVLDVASRIGELVAAGPSGRADDFGGPEVLSLEQVLRSVVAALGRDRRFVSVPPVGKVFRGYAAGHHLAPGLPTGGRTFADHLAEHVHKADNGQIKVDQPYRFS
jgi:uncharacterized protein YbjT (DUF2867 family)